MKLLDTTFLIHYWAGVEAVAEYLEANEEREFVTTTLNLKEVAVGRALQGKLDRAEILTRFDWIRVVPFEAEHAFVASRLEADLRAGDLNEDGINALAGDLLIAAVARAEGATVVTRNVDDFERFDGVTVEAY